jgi:hypothetical protein
MKILTSADKATAAAEYAKEETRKGYPNTKPGTRFGPGPHADGGMVYTVAEYDMLQTKDGKTFGVLVPDTAKPVAGCVLVDAKAAAWADAKPVAVDVKPLEAKPLEEKPPK